MLISPKLIHRVYKIKPNGVLHVGAHDGEEQDDYDKLGWGPVTWIEAMPNKVERLHRLINSPNRVIEACVWDSNETEMILHEANNSQATSLLELGTSLSRYPEIEVVREIKVLTKRLDSLELDFNRIDFLNLDIQGAELQALKGMGPKIFEISYVYSEVNRESVYKGCALIAEMDDFLSQKGFTRIDTIWTNNGWGDALWVKNELIPKMLSARVFLRKFITIPQIAMMLAERIKKLLINA